MAKNKKKKPVAAETAQNEPKAERKPNRKERLAMEEAHNQEMAKKRRNFYGIAIAIALISVLLNFRSGTYIGQPLYEQLQIACFALMGVSGALFTAGSHYEVEERHKQSKRSVGLVLVAISAGFIVVEIVKMVM